MKSFSTFSHKVEDLQKLRGQFKRNHKDTQMSFCLDDVTPCGSEFISVTTPGDPCLCNHFVFCGRNRGPCTFLLHPDLCSLVQMRQHASGLVMKLERGSSA